MGPLHHRPWKERTTNTEWYQIRAAVHDGTLFWGPWVTIQDGGLPMATLSGIKSGQQYMMVHYLGAMCGNSRW